MSSHNFNLSCITLKFFVQLQPLDMTHIYVMHYNDVIMTTIASQITSLAVVYSTVISDADQRKHQSSASLVFVWGIHRDRWIPRTKGQLRGTCFHLMTSSWYVAISSISSASPLATSLNIAKYKIMCRRTYSCIFSEIKHLNLDLNA